MTSSEKPKEQKGLFPHVEKKALGYEPKQVEEYLDRVKKFFETPDFDHEDKITSTHLRNKSFRLKRKGYDPRFVDAALERLEDVFFERERKEIIKKQGQKVWSQNVQELFEDICFRMQKDRGVRFKKTSFMAYGYKISQVDAVIDQLADAIEKSEYVKPTQVRQVKFHSQRSGYNEAQVDAFLDGVTEYFLSIKK